MDDVMLRSRSFEHGQVNGAFENAEHERSMSWCSAAFKRQGVYIEDVVLHSQSFDHGEVNPASDNVKQ